MLEEKVKEAIADAQAIALVTIDEDGRAHGVAVGKNEDAIDRSDLPALICGLRSLTYRLEGLLEESWDDVD